jgi:hypothetical protein
MEKLSVIKNPITILNFKKFEKMSLEDFEKNKEKYIVELNEDNYYYLLAIKSGNSEKFTEDKDLVKLKKLSLYFFGKIPVIHQKSLIKEYEQNILHQSSEKTLQELLHGDFRVEYVQVLKAYIYTLNFYSKFNKD